MLNKVVVFRSLESILVLNSSPVKRGPKNNGELKTAVIRKSLPRSHSVPLRDACLGLSRKVRLIFQLLLSIYICNYFRLFNLEIK